MIRIVKDAVNTVVVTLSENQTQSPTVYLFQFTNQQTNVDYYFTAVDISNHKKRYNQFSITETETPNLLNGQVNLPEECFYNYTIHQTSLASLAGITNINQVVSAATIPLEYGKVWVVPSASSVVSYTPQNDTSIVYQPE